jgi:hypothetical protein
MSPEYLLSAHKDSWRISGGSLEDLWRISGGSLEDLWRISGGSLGAPCIHPGTIREESADSAL